MRLPLFDESSWLAGFMRKLSAILLLGAALMMGGVHLGVLQGVAWMGMLWNSVGERGWESALQETFGGEAPCDLCRTVQTLQNAPGNDGPAPFVLVNFDWKGVSDTPSQPVVEPPAHTPLAPESASLKPIECYGAVPHGPPRLG